MKTYLFCLQMAWCSIILGQLETDSSEFVFLTGAQMQSDLDSLSEYILRMHPAPFAHCSEQDWSDQLTKSKRMVLGGGNIYKAAKSCSDLTSLLRDSHTGIALQHFANSLANSYGQIPIEIATVENKAVVVKDWTNTIMPGSVVESIGGIDSRSILGMSMSLISQEGEAVISRLRMADKLWNDLVPFALGGVGGDHVPFVLDQQFQNESMLPILVREELDLLKMAASTPEIRWNWVEEYPGVVHLKIRSFHPEQLQKFKRELKDCFKAIRSWEKEHGQSISGLILDLRQNSGGHIAVMAEILPYLASVPTRIPFGVQIKHSPEARSQLMQPTFGRPFAPFGYHKNFKILNQAIRNRNDEIMTFVPFESAITPRRRLKYEGPAVMLLDGLSASASVSLAAWFVRSGRGKTIGEPPMGSISGTFGNPIRITLPSSGIQVNVATARYYTEAPIRWETRPLLPDFPVTKTIEDYVFDRDPFLERALRWLNHMH
jgi:C-terminal processing protease CtpA/Prc